MPLNKETKSKKAVEHKGDNNIVKTSALERSPKV